MARVEKKRKPEAAPKTPMELLMHEHLNALSVRGYSENTVQQPPRPSSASSSTGPMSTACANPSKSRGPCSNAISGICSSTARRTASR